jgi:hypothetical protein
LRATKNKQVLSGVAAFFILVTVFSSLCFCVHAQNVTVFSSSDRFSIPVLNGSVRFAYNGTYSSAKLENDTWIFSDLTLTNFSRRLGDLRVSVQDSNITIYSFASSAISSSRQSVRYFAEGSGRQVFKLGITGTTHPSEWWVTISVPNTIFLAEGKEWQLLSDNTAIVKGQTGNISVSHFNFGITEDSNVPFIQRHSILIETAVLVAVTIGIASVITVRVRKKQRGN